MNNPVSPSTSELSRRQFLAGTGAAAVSFSVLQPSLVRAADANAKIDIGVIGCGGRGKFIGDLFAKDGHYNVVAVADYFADRAESAAKQFGIPASRCFSGLQSYQRLLEQKLDAVAIESPPFFHPMQAAAAVAAGKHVYCAKPIAVDVPGCQSIADSAKHATGKKLAFLVDFQTRAHPAYQEVVNRTRKGDIGKIVSVESSYHCPLYFADMDAEFRKAKDPKSSEARLRAWAIDRVLSGDVITEQNIHTLDVATWFLDAAPVKAYGTGGRARDFLGDCWDHYAVIFQFAGGAFVSFNSKQVGYAYDDIMCRVHGLTGTAETHYSGKVWLKSKEDGYEGNTQNLYVDGVRLNMATFYNAIAKGDFSNPTVAPSVRSNLTTILGRMAAYQGGEVTWADMLKKNERWNFDLGGLKA